MYSFRGGRIVSYYTFPYSFGDTFPYRLWHDFLGVRTALNVFRTMVPRHRFRGNSILLLELIIGMKIEVRSYNLEVALYN